MVHRFREKGKAQQKKKGVSHGVSIPPRNNRDGYWVFVRHAGEPIAFKYDTEEEAHDVAKAFLQEIALGRLDVAALKKRRDPEKERRCRFVSDCLNEIDT
jgi:hypothetical protein